MPIITKDRNGEIDILRFLFSVIIVLGHFSESFHFDFAKTSWIGVEFFFLTSGFFMAQHAKKINAEKHEIANQTWKYEINKARSFYRYYIVGIALNLIIRSVLIQQKSIVTIWNSFLQSIPTFGLFFIGTNSNSIGLYLPNTWFLSAMMITCFILYPILLWNFEISTKIIFPIFSVLLLGYMFTSKGTINFTHQSWSVIINLALLRSTAEMAMGASLVPLCGLMKKTLQNKQKGTFFGISLTIIKWFCYILVILHAFGMVGVGKVSLHFLLFCACGLLLSLSGEGFVIPSTRVTKYLGKVSLPIFLFHGVIRYSLVDYLNMKGYGQISLTVFALFIFSCVLVCVLVMHFTDFIGVKILHKQKHLQ